MSIVDERRLIANAMPVTKTGCGQNKRFANLLTDTGAINAVPISEQLVLQSVADLLLAFLMSRRVLAFSVLRRLDGVKNRIKLLN